MTPFSALLLLLCYLITFVFWLSQTLAAPPGGSWGRGVRTQFQECLGRVWVGKERGKQEAFLGVGAVHGNLRNLRTVWVLWGELPLCQPPSSGPQSVDRNWVEVLDMRPR